MAIFEEFVPFSDVSDFAGFWHKAFIFLCFSRSSDALY